MEKRFPLILVAVIFFLVSAGETVDITRVGKRTQLDGFLIDWKAGERRAWSGSENWFWGALNTPEGVAGYFSTTGVRCTSWVFTIDAGHGVSRIMRLAASSLSDTNIEGILFAASSLTVRDSMSALITEWIIPWDALEVDGGRGGYTISVTGASVCGDSLPPLRFTGYASTEPGRERPGFLLWGIFAALAAAAAGVFTVRKKDPRTQDLRREQRRR